METIYRLIEVYAGRLYNWAWNKRWKNRDHHKWIKGYREWKKKKQTNRMKSIITSHAQFPIRYTDDGDVRFHHPVPRYGYYLLT